jgi:4,5:9,10-diseco-3-hydroxy-5,9,17-trioxoandrosta-1(10),2-diene-4-oate hydrolase
MDFTQLEAFYGQIAQPVLLIWGRDDRITPVAWGERLANRLPRAHLEVVPQCGHLPMVEVPLTTSNAVIRFLAGGDV